MASKHSICSRTRSILPSVQFLAIVPFIAYSSDRAVCGRSLAEIAGSNPVGVMDVCLLLVFVLSGRGLYDGLITRPEESYEVWYVCV
jgi:hypothetical protein